jgi:hypothetical protein
MSSTLPSPKPTPKETTSLRQIVDLFVPPEDKTDDENAQVTVRYMRNLMRSVAAKSADIMDQEFDADEVPNVTEGLYRFFAGDIFQALEQMQAEDPDKKTLTEADLVKITPDGTADRLATDLRNKIKALTN